MAVQLARLSLWLATLAADRPLSFLDHRLLSGDSLLGAWLTNLKRPPVPPRRVSAGRGSLPLFDDDTVRAALSSALPVRFALESTPNDTLDQVRAKERALAAITADDSSLSRWKRVADTWCASWFASTVLPAAAFGALTDKTLTGSGALPGRIAKQYLETARAM